MRFLQNLLNVRVVSDVSLRGSALIVLDEVRKRISLLRAAEHVYVVLLDESARVGGEKVAVLSSSVCVASQTKIRAAVEFGARLHPLASRLA
jgi:hypothetical protein